MNVPRQLIWFLLAALVFGFGSTEAQQSKKLPLIGYLSSETVASEAPRSGAIRDALRDLGYMEGQNITIEYRYGQGRLDQAVERVAELAARDVDLLVVSGGEGWVRAAQNVTKTVPIVMTGTGSDPVEEGLVKSLAKPGGNTTGITNLTKELGGKRLDLLKQTLPRLAYVAVLYNPTAPGTVREV